MATPNQIQLATVPAQPDAQPIAVAGHTTVIVQQHGGCCCSVPPDTTRSVKASRWSSIAAIVIHTLALVTLGLPLWSARSTAQWIASLIGIIMGSILLCFFDRWCYVIAVVLFSVGIFFDIFSALSWVYNGDVIGLALLPAFGAVAFATGATAASVAVCNWHEIAAPDARVTQNERVQIVHRPPSPSINATAGQHDYS